MGFLGVMVLVSLQDLFKIFECPGCKMQMRPPFHQCEQGHNCCATCFNNTRCCSICKKNPSIARSWSLEKLHDKLKFHCDYQHVKQLFAFDIQELLHEFECCVCRSYMHPPIPQCDLGHICCFKCFQKLDSCPSCRENLSSVSRSWSMERFHNKLSFPCENSENGCSKIIPGSHILDHELYCKYRFLKCPLGLDDCNWSGYLVDIDEHFLSNHDNNYSTTSNVTITHPFICDESCTSDHFNFKSLFHVFGEYFIFTWNIDQSTGFSRWCVFVMREPDCENSFDYVIRINEGSSKNLFLRAKCPVVSGDYAELDYSHYLIYPYVVLKTFSNHDSLNYTVEVINNDL